MDNQQHLLFQLLWEALRQTRLDHFPLQEMRQDVDSSRSLPEITEPPQVVEYVERGATIKNGTVFKLKDRPCLKGHMIHM